MPAMTQDCAAVLSNGRRVLESVLALTAGTSAVWLGARWHAAPRRAVRTAVEHSGNYVLRLAIRRIWWLV